jgi:hypothetical protein
VGLAVPLAGEGALGAVLAGDVELLGERCWRRRGPLPGGARAWGVAKGE